MSTGYKRILLKLSGEALAGETGFGIDNKVLASMVEQIGKVHAMGVEVGIVIGAGNFWRGRQGTDMDRVTADQMGMVATILNCLALRDALDRAGIAARVQSAVPVGQFVEPFDIRRTLAHFKKGRVVIFGGGTGCPFFTTDTGAALKAAEIKADALLLAKNVDGIYDSDPKKNPNAVKYERISPKDFIAQGLTAMDATAVTLCMDNDIPVVAFGLSEENSILRVVSGEKMGTIIG